MRADPFRHVGPFPTDGEEPTQFKPDGGVLTVTFATFPGDDPLERWESEGGRAR